MEDSGAVRVQDVQRRGVVDRRDGNFIFGKLFNGGAEGEVSVQVHEDVGTILDATAATTHWTKEELQEMPDIEEYVEEIFAWKKCAKRIPVKVRPLFARALSLSLRTISENPESLRAWTLFWAIPFMCLQISPKRNGKTGDNAAAIAERLSRFVRGDIRSLFQEAVQTRQQNAAVQPQSSQPQKCNRSAKFEELFAEGRSKEALKEFMVNGGGIRHEYNMEIDKVFKEKLPRCALPKKDVDAVVKEIRNNRREFLLKAKPKDAADMIKAAKKHAGPGLSGYRTHHWRDALTVDNTKGDLQEELAKVITLICEGFVPFQLLPYLHGGRGGIQGEKRLFIASDSLIRIVEAWVQRQIVAKYKVRKLFEHGVGIGVKGAADVLQHRIGTFMQEARDAGVVDPVLIEVDAVNMFHSLKRDALIRMAAAEYPEMLPLMRGLMCPHFISFFNGTLWEQSTSGVSIGSGMAALLASLAAERIMKDLMTQITEGGKFARCVAYIDNTMFVVPAADAQEIVTKLNHKANLVGLSYALRPAQPHKVLFISNPQTDQNQGMIALDAKKIFRSWNITAMEGTTVRETSGRSLGNIAGGIKCAGALAGDDEYLKQMCQARLEKACQYLEAMEKGLRPQEFHWLAVSCVQTKMADLARKVPPEICQPYLASFDKALMQALQRKMDGVGDWWETKAWRYAVPTYGLRQLGVTTQAAYIASVIAAKGFDNEINVPKGFDKCVADFNQRVEPENMISMENIAKMTAQGTVVGVQRKLTKQVRAAQLKHVVQTLNQDPQANRQKLKKLALLTRKGTARYLEPDYGTVLSDVHGRQLQFSDEQFKYRVRALGPESNCHFNLSENFETKCQRRTKDGVQCGHVLRTWEEYFSHHETNCRIIRGAAKHTAGATALASIARELGGGATLSGLTIEAGAQARKQSQADKEEEASGKKVRVDVIINGVDGKSHSVDFYSMNPMCDGKPGPALDREGKVKFPFEIPDHMAATEAEKTKTYVRALEYTDDFIPFGMDTFGMLSKGSRALTKVFANRLVEIEGIDWTIARKHIKRRIAVGPLRQAAQNGVDAMRWAAAARNAFIEARTQREIDRITAAATAAAGVDENVEHDEQQNVPVAPRVVMQQNVPVVAQVVVQQNVPVVAQVVVQQNVPHLSAISDRPNAPPVQSIQGNNNNPPTVTHPKQEEAAVTRDPSPLRLRSRTVQRNQ